MNLKLVVAICALAATPAFAQVPKPTEADVQKVVKIISADKAKMATYCDDLPKLDPQIAEADEKKNSKEVEELYKQHDAISQKLGPEYVSLMSGLERVDPDSPEGKDVSAALDALGKLCTKK